MLETLDWYQISWNLVLPIHVMDQVEVVHVKYHLGITYSQLSFGCIILLDYSQGDFSANSLMFLFSGRAYWQELIESILWSHHKLKIIPHIQPTALSISQGRAVGLDFLTYFLPSEASKGVYPPCAGLLFGLSDWI